MAIAQILFDSDYERAIIRTPGVPDVLRHLRDEAEAARFAHEMGYIISSAWELFSGSGESPSWGRAFLRRCA